MQLRASALVCAVRPHGETAVVARVLTDRAGLVAVYVAGGRGRQLRPVLIPGNLVDADIRSRTESQLPFARLELLESRGPWLTEPLHSAAIAWLTALSAAVLPERQPFPALFEALSGVLGAIGMAPSARGWIGPLMLYERLLLRELGYGDRDYDDGGRFGGEQSAEWSAVLIRFDWLGQSLKRNLLAPRQSDVMAARALLRERLARIEGI